MAERWRRHARRPRAFALVFAASALSAMIAVGGVLAIDRAGAGAAIIHLDPERAHVP